MLLKKGELPLEIEIHTDPLCILPAALSIKRAFKKNKLLQEEAQDNIGSAGECLFCNPEKLDGNPSVTFHCDKKAMSFPNSAPFLPGDQRVICLWHDNAEKRYAYAHKFRYSDFGMEEFYYLTLSAIELSKEFPSTCDGKKLLEESNDNIRCIAGFNIGKLAGQSIPHFHLQYGWEVLLNPKKINEQLLGLFYLELSEKKLIMFENDKFYIIVPWTPKGQYHIEIHLKNKYEISQLEEIEVKILTYIAKHIMNLYYAAGIRNLNILFIGSPHKKKFEPLTVQFVPRVNMTALYEMIGVNVVDTPPEHISTFFQMGFRWQDIVKEANQFDAKNLYRNRFEKDYSLI